MKRYLALLLMVLAYTTSAYAQDKIDRLFENFSSRGNSNYNSFVMRDPKTKKVLKVVKTLQITGPIANVGKFVATFDEESRKATATERQQGNGITRMTLIFASPTKYSVYNLNGQAQNVTIKVVENYDVEKIKELMRTTKTK